MQYFKCDIHDHAGACKVTVPVNQYLCISHLGFINGWHFRLAAHGINLVPTATCFCDDYIHGTEIDQIMTCKCLIRSPSRRHHLRKEDLRRICSRAGCNVCTEYSYTSAVVAVTGRQGPRAHLKVNPPPPLAHPKAYLAGCVHDAIVLPHLHRRQL
jgi:hypothetical protein